MSDEVSKQSKIFNDPIHGYVEIHPICLSIIDTAVFQRLRYIKQAGAASYVYPGACHTRFEHSIGVSHLAGKFASHIKEKQPELEIDDKDILCVKVAGLCHDLGRLLILTCNIYTSHGPFSHTWEKVMAKSAPHKHWKHEINSVRLLDYLLKTEYIRDSFLKYFGKHCDTYIILIKQQICGSIESRKAHPWTVGVNKTKHKNFLYEIVANQLTGIDVDKWDYIARDCRHMGFKDAFDRELQLKFARVCKADDGEWHICLRDKTWLNVHQLFRTRWMFHKIGYQHNVVKLIDIMLTEAFSKASKYIQIKGADGLKGLSEASDDPEAFIKLTDAIFQMILHSDDENLASSKTILQNIERRKLYGFIGRAIIDASFANEIHLKQTQVSAEIYEFIADKHRLNVDDIIVEKQHFDYGMNDKNPLEYVYYYTKSDPTVARREIINNHSEMTIVQFQEYFLFCVCRQQSLVIDVREAFHKWCKLKGLNPLTNKFEDCD